MQQLENDIKELIISSLALEDISPADIDAAAPLFVDGLGLDSIDALELGLALQKRYGVSLSAESEEVRAHFASVKALADLYADPALAPGFVAPQLATLKAEGAKRRALEEQSLSFVSASVTVRPNCPIASSVRIDLALPSRSTLTLRTVNDSLSCVNSG